MIVALAGLFSYPLFKIGPKIASFILVLFIDVSHDSIFNLCLQFQAVVKIKSCVHFFKSFSSHHFFRSLSLNN